MISQLESSATLTPVTSLVPAKFTARQFTLEQLSQSQRCACHWKVSEKIVMWPLSPSSLLYLSGRESELIIGRSGVRHLVSTTQSEFSEFLRQRRRRILTTWHLFQFSLGTAEKEPKEFCSSHDARKCKIDEKLIATLTEANQLLYKRRMFVKNDFFSRYLRPWSNASVTWPYPIRAACSIPYSFAICAVLLAVKNADFNGMMIVLNDRE